MIVDNYDFAGWTVQDPIHGAIHFGPIEKAIIDHSLFQRLHGLRQNALLYLIFPSANHTRFDHSLGVMYLAGKFLDSVIRNQQMICETGSTRTKYQNPLRVDDAYIRDTVQTLKDEPYYRISLRAAALFHDIGHGPLSHLFDEFFPTFRQMIIFTNSREYHHVRARLSKENNQSARITHEILSCVIATRTLNDISTTLSNYGIDSQRMAQDVCAILDPLMPTSNYFEGTPYKIHSLLHDIISSDLDADRMDYLLRDSQMCGVNYGLYDPDRILKSMCAYARTDTKELRVAVRYSGIGALEDLMFSRYQMRAQIYGHKTNRACDAMLSLIHDRLQKAQWTWHEHISTANDLLRRFVRFDDKAFIGKLRMKEADLGKGKVKEIAEKLFGERKLFKRVYEERARDKTSARAAEKRWKDYQIKLRKAGIRFKENVFKNESPIISSPNYPLKALRKHPQHGYYMVHELREFSSVAHYLPTIEYIYRVYCKSIYAQRAKALLV